MLRSDMNLIRFAPAIWYDTWDDTTILVQVTGNAIRYMMYLFVLRVNMASDTNRSFDVNVNEIFAISVANNKLTRLV